MDKIGTNPAKHRWLLPSGAGLCGIAVILGAFGAHALRSRVGAQALGWWETAVQYQMWHGLAVVAMSLAGRGWMKLPAFLFVAGAILFSGSLYAMALGAPRWLGAVTPVGGLTLIAGWVMLAAGGLRRGELS